MTWPNMVLSQPKKGTRAVGSYNRFDLIDYGPVPNMASIVELDDLGLQPVAVRWNDWGFGLFFFMYEEFCCLGVVF